MSLEIPTAPRRVKVYQLNDEDWLDKGTGYCVGDLQNRDTAAYILVRNEENPDDILLSSHVKGTTQYQKQQETLIVWTEKTPSGKMDVALSFQEAEGCANVCDFLVYVQESLEPNITLVAVHTQDDETEVTEVIAGPTPIPPDPTLENLVEIEDTLTNCAANQYWREDLIEYLRGDHWIEKFVGLLNVAEETKAIDRLHEMCRIVRVLFMLNETRLFGNLLEDDVGIQIFGMLEYDPDHPKLKANHRDYLQNEAEFKEVVPIPHDNIRAKIQQTFRIQFLKDVVLARLLDDSTYSMLSSMIYFNQMEIIGYLQNSSDFTKQLFALYKAGNDTPDAKKIDGVRFVHQVSGIAKNFQAQQRTTLYSSLIKSGLFLLVQYALKHKDLAVRMLGTELMVTIIDHDANLVRNHSLEEEEQKQYGEVITRILIDLLSSDEDVGLKSQAGEALKVLLDPGPPAGGPTLAGAVRLAEMPQLSAAAIAAAKRPNQDFDMSKFLAGFYETTAKELFAYIIELGNESENGESSSGKHGSSTPDSGNDDGNENDNNNNKLNNDDDKNNNESDDKNDSNERKNKKKRKPRHFHDLGKLSGRAYYEQLCDVLAFCIKNHGEKCRDFTVSTHMWQGIKQLIKVDSAPAVRLAAVKVLKQALAMDDNGYVDEIIDETVIGAVIDDIVEMGNRNTLLHSACLDVLAMIERGTEAPAARQTHSGLTISRHRMRRVLNHLVEVFGDALRKLDYVPIAKVLLERHLQSPSAMYAEQMNSMQTDADGAVLDRVIDVEHVAMDDDILNLSDYDEFEYLKRDSDLDDDDDDDDFDFEEDDAENEQPKAEDEENRDLPFVPVGEHLQLQAAASISAQEPTEELKSGSKRHGDATLSAQEKRRGPRRRRTSENFTQELLERRDAEERHDTDDDEPAAAAAGAEEQSVSTSSSSSSENGKREEPVHDLRAKKSRSFKRTLTAASKKLSMKFRSSEDKTGKPGKHDETDERALEVKEK